MPFFFIFILSLFSFFPPAPLFAEIPPLSEEENSPILSHTFRAEVVSILEEKERALFGTENATEKIQILSLKKMSDEENIIIVENDLFPLKIGDRVYISEMSFSEEEKVYTIAHSDRTLPLFLLIFAVIILLLLFSGTQGMKALFALLGSILVIAYILLPLILSGIHPLLVTFIVALFILFFAIFFTHGFTKISFIAYSGSLLSIFITTLIALYAVESTRLSGKGEELATFLTYATNGTLDFHALLLGAIIIGTLGVLDDVAITQTATVRELFLANPSYTKKQAYFSAMRVGKDHVSAVINTLMLAYVGASLPLLLYIYTTSSSFFETMSMELFATEIVRTIIGTMGIILTVPIVTFLSVHFLKTTQKKETLKN